MTEEVHFNEEAFNSVFSTEPEPVEVVEAAPEPIAEDVTPEPEAKPEVNEEEAKASQRGWTSKAEWVAQGKDPDEWVSAKHFNEKGTLISKAREFEALQKTFKADVDNVKKYVQAQAQMQIQQLQQQNAELLEAKRNAVQYGDWDGVQKAEQALTNNAISQLNLQQQMQSPQPNQPSAEELAVEAQYYKENPWVFVEDPAHADYGKSVYAKNVYNQLLQDKSMDVHQRLEYLQADLARKFPPKPPTNPNRDKPGITDSKPSGKLSGEITWGHLNDPEREEFKAFGHLFGDPTLQGKAREDSAKKNFLKAVKNSRG